MATPHDFSAETIIEKKKFLDSEGNEIVKRSLLTTFDFCEYIQRAFYQLLFDQDGTEVRVNVEAAQEFIDKLVLILRPVRMSLQEELDRYKNGAGVVDKETASPPTLIVGQGDGTTEN